MEQEFKNDHDAIITLISEVRQARTEIREIRDGTKEEISELKVRVEKLEKSASLFKLVSTGYYIIGGAALGLLVYHVLTTAH